jgi:ribonuclease HI
MPSVLSKPFHVYTDGSCIHQSDIVRRMAGIGVYFPTHNVHNISAPLPGEKQTSARAELVAVVRALEKAEAIDGLRPLVIHSDNTYALLETNRILAPHKHKVIKGVRENADVLKELARLLLVRKAEVTTVKVKAHSGNPDNDAADKLAEHAARAAFDRRHGAPKVVTSVLK